MAEKDNFQKEVVDALLNSGFKDIFQQQQHKEFIEMIAATYFTNQLKFDGMIEYLADVIENQDQRRKIAEIVRDLKTSKYQKKPQPPKQKEQKVQKKPEKKVKQDYPPKPRQNKTSKPQQNKPEGQGIPVDQPNGAQKKGLKHELQTSGKSKCRFFPFCKNPDSCEFFHPTDKCQYFPNCRYGQNCLYVHEPCRFKQNCTKLNCPFAHPGKRPANPLEAFMKSMMMGKNPGMFNKNKKKRPHQDAKEDEQQQQ